MSTRISSVVCFSQKGDGGGLVRQYGRVQCFFLHEYRNSKRMLAYIQIYRGKDRSVEWGYTQEGKIIEVQREGRMEVVDVTAIDEGIGIIEAARGRYLIIRRRTLEKED